MLTPQELGAQRAQGCPVLREVPLLVRLLHRDRDALVPWRDRGVAVHDLGHVGVDAFAVDELGHSVPIGPLRLVG